LTTKRGTSSTREVLHGEHFTRVLGLHHVTASGIGVIIGAGIYILIGPATQRAGALVWMSMIVSAVVCAFTALSYMELTSMFPRAGSEHEFARQVFPEWVAFTTGWAMAVALVVAASAVSLGFARYLSEFVNIPERPGAVLLLIVVWLIALTGMQHARWLIIVLSAIQIGGLLLVVALGVDTVGDVNLWQGNGASGVLSGAAVIFFAYIGFDEVITLSEETHNPSSTIPRALFLALGISTLIYIAVAVVAVSVLGVDGLANADQPLTAVMEIAIGGVAVDVVGAIALATTANTTLLASVAASRMLYSMANTGHLHPRFAEVHNGRAPRFALGVVIMGAIFLAILGGIEMLAEASNALIYVMFIVVNIVLIMLRYQRPHDHRPFRVRGDIGWLPVLPVVGILATTAMATQLDLQPLLIAFTLLATGVVVHYAGKKIVW
jgi:APA family basic amino acid/polyamine antiporter